MKTPIIRAVSISGGKDSLAMALRLLEEEPGDDLRFIFFDFGIDYPDTYATIERFERKTGMHVETLKPQHDFLWYAAEKPVKHKNANPKYRLKGYGWPTMLSRWCTRVKVETMLYYKRTAFAGCTFIDHIGIAADEPKRIRTKPNVRYPLVEWGMTEADCLAYCRARGYFPPGHPYDFLKRVSCCSCPLCANREIAYLIHHRPELWEKIKVMEAKIGEPWKRGTDCYEERFASPLFDNTMEIK